MSDRPQSPCLVRRNKKKLLGPFNRKGLQQHFVCQRKNGCVCPDAKRECQNHNGSKARLLNNHPKCITNVRESGCHCVPLNLFRLMIFDLELVLGAQASTPACRPTPPIILWWIMLGSSVGVDACAPSTSSKSPILIIHTAMQSVGLLATLDVQVKTRQVKRRVSVSKQLRSKSRDHLDSTQTIGSK